VSHVRTFWVRVRSLKHVSSARHKSGHITFLWPTDRNVIVLRNTLDHNESIAIQLPLILTFTLRFKIGVFLDVSTIKYSQAFSESAVSSFSKSKNKRGLFDPEKTLR
jgi:hypothetical protein